MTRTFLVSLWTATLFVGCDAATSPSSLATAPPPAAIPRATGTATIDFLDVGQGDSILVRSPEGNTMLVDAGPTNDVVRLLKKRGVQTIDLAVVSHHHADHYGGMDDVIRAFPVANFLATNSSHTTKRYRALLKLVDEHGIRPLAPEDNPRRLQLGSMTVTVFPQPPEDHKEENNNSIGLRVEFGTVAVLLTGDSQEAERAWWMQHCPELAENCQVLKLAHHGSRNGTDARWLQLVTPRVAVASCGAGNDYGHPHAQTIDLLARARVELLRTDEAGTIEVTTDGKGWKVSTGGASIRAPPKAAHKARSRH
jgi:competence protein ComEC